VLLVAERLTLRLSLLIAPLRSHPSLSFALLLLRPETLTFFRSALPSRATKILVKSNLTISTAAIYCTLVVRHVVQVSLC
jgi:hypothetical protein